MRVLVTGHKGYIGSVMVPLLDRRRSRGGGARHGPLRSLQLRRSPAGSRRRRPARPPGRRAPPSRGFEAVVHLAALSNDPLGDLDAQLTYDINHLASVRLARAARQAGVERFLFASSCSLYGASGTGAPLTEEAPFNPVTPYGESKILVEQDVTGLADDGVQPGVLPQRHGLRRLAAPAGRHHGQQPRRLRGHDR